MVTISLRALEPTDLDALYRAENELSLWDCQFVTAPLSRYQLSRFIERATNNAYLDGEVHFAIDNEQGHTVGFINLQNIEPLHARAEIGIVILPRYRRKGFASAGLANVAMYAKRHLQLHQLYAYISQNNAESLSLFQKANYKISTTLTDWISTPEGWQDVYLCQLLL